jgi:hypothetical protein
VNIKNSLNVAAINVVRSGKDAMAEEDILAQQGSLNGQQLPDDLPVYAAFFLAHSLRIQVKSGADIRVP